MFSIFWILNSEKGRLCYLVANAWKKELKGRWNVCQCEWLNNTLLYKAVTIGCQIPSKNNVSTFILQSFSSPDTSSVFELLMCSHSFEPSLPQYYLFCWKGCQAACKLASIKTHRRVLYYSLKNMHDAQEKRWGLWWDSTKRFKKIV